MNLKSFFKSLLTIFHSHKYKNTRMFTHKEDSGDKVIEQKCKCGKTRYHHRLSGFYFPENPTLRYPKAFIETDISGYLGSVEMSNADKIKELSQFVNS